MSSVSEEEENGLYIQTPINLQWFFYVVITVSRV